MQIEKTAKCPRGRIGNAYSAKRAPTTKVCGSIADGLHLSREYVLQRAGILKAPPTASEGREAEEAAGLFDALQGHTIRQAALSMLRALVSQQRDVVYEVNDKETSYEATRQGSPLQEFLAEQLARQLVQMSAEDQQKVFDVMKQIREQDETRGAGAENGAPSSC